MASIRGLVGTFLASITGVLAIGSTPALGQADPSPLSPVKQLLEQSIEGLDFGKLNVCLDCPEKAFFGDKSRLEQVFQNLLQNALGHAKRQVQIIARFEKGIS